LAITLLLAISLLGLLTLLAVARLALSVALLRVIAPRRLRRTHNRLLRCSQRTPGTIASLPLTGNASRLVFAPFCGDHA
jgi:hypothetical protein